MRDLVDLVEEMKKTMELKPCPFCGANGNDIQPLEYYLPWCKGINVICLIYCTNCGGAIIDQDKNHCYNDRKKLWNRRVGKEEVDEHTG